jgi:hypothetical protein
MDLIGIGDRRWGERQLWDDVGSSTVCNLDVPNSTSMRRKCGAVNRQAPRLDDTQETTIRSQGQRSLHARELEATFSSDHEEHGPTLHFNDAIRARLIWRSRANEVQVRHMVREGWSFEREHAFSRRPVRLKLLGKR